MWLEKTLEGRTSARVATPAINSIEAKAARKSNTGRGLRNNRRLFIVEVSVIYGFFRFIWVPGLLGRQPSGNYGNSGADEDRIGFALNFGLMFFDFLTSIHHAKTHW